MTQGTQILDCFSQKQFDDGSSGAEKGEPLSITTLGWFVKIRPIQKEEFARRWILSEIIWLKP